MGLPAGGVHATRRARGGARKEVSARVTLTGPGGVKLEGWALNVGRGGVRVILEVKVEPGSDFDVTITDAAGQTGPQPGRVVWVQDEPDGVVAGIEFRTVGPAGARGKP
jgi:hypothetical protein